VFTTPQWRNTETLSTSGSIWLELMQCALNTSMKTARNKLIKTLDFLGKTPINVLMIHLEGTSENELNLLHLILSSKRKKSIGTTTERTSTLLLSSITEHTEGYLSPKQFLKRFVQGSKRSKVSAQ